MIEVQALKKTFGSTRAADGVSFTARDGEVTGLLGPNGAGKTTSLRMIYALAPPDSGRVRIDGQDCTGNVAQAAQHIGVLPDTRGLYPRLTAREHLHYFGELHGLESREVRHRAQELVRWLEMEKIADRRVGGFSQGERVKVVLARALMHEPQNILMDEPTNGLDVMSTRAWRAHVLRLKTQGKCILFSSHIMQEVTAICDRVVVIAKGKVAADGTTAELLHLTGKGTLEDAFVELIGSEGEGVD